MLQRNLNLVLQTLEISNHVVVCANLLDEAEKKHIEIDTRKLQEELGVEVVLMSARSQIGLNELKEAILRCREKQSDDYRIPVTYAPQIETALAHICDCIQTSKGNPRFLAFKLLEQDDRFYQSVEDPQAVKKVVDEQREKLKRANLLEHLEDHIVSALGMRAKQIADTCITYHNQSYYEKDRKIDAE